MEPNLVAHSISAKADWALFRLVAIELRPAQSAAQIFDKRRYAGHQKDQDQQSSMASFSSSAHSRPRDPSRSSMAA